MASGRDKESREIAEARELEEMRKWMRMMSTRQEKFEEILEEMSHSLAYKEPGMKKKRKMEEEVSSASNDCVEVICDTPRDRLDRDTTRMLQQALDQYQEVSRKILYLGGYNPDIVKGGTWVPSGPRYISLEVMMERAEAFGLLERPEMSPHPIGSHTEYLCRYHMCRGHDTEHCVELKKIIDQLIAEDRIPMTPFLTPGFTEDDGAPKATRLGYILPEVI